MSWGDGVCVLGRFCAAVSQDVALGGSGAETRGPSLHQLIQLRANLQGVTPKSLLKSQGPSRLEFDSHSGREPRDPLSIGRERVVSVVWTGGRDSPSGLQRTRGVLESGQTLCGRHRVTSRRRTASCGSTGCPCGTEPPLPAAWGASQPVPVAPCECRWPWRRWFRAQEGGYSGALGSRPGGKASAPARSHQGRSHAVTSRGALGLSTSASGF